MRPVHWLELQRGARQPQARAACGATRKLAALVRQGCNTEHVRTTRSWASDHQSVVHCRDHPRHVPLPLLRLGRYAPQPWRGACHAAAGGCTAVARAQHLQRQRPSRASQGCCDRAPRLGQGRKSQVRSAPRRECSASLPAICRRRVQRCAGMADREDRVCARLSTRVACSGVAWTCCFKAGCVTQTGGPVAALTRW